MKKRVVVVTEGDTEYDFVQRVLRSELKNADVIARNMRGGSISVPYVLKYIRPLLYDKFDCITTMVDFYKFANPGRGNSADDMQRKLAAEVEQSNRGSRTVFLPYVQKHEFEALLFADRTAMSKCLDLSAAQHKKLNAIKGKPEDINHDAPPSVRILGIHGGYEKVINGVDIVQEIGLVKIAHECPRFGEWLAKLRKIAEQ